MSDKMFGKRDERIESYAVDTNLGLVALSIGFVAFGVLVLVYLTRKMGVLNVSQRNVAAPASHQVLNRQPQMLQRPSQNRGAPVPRFIAGEEGAEMDFGSDSEAGSEADLIEGLRNRTGKLGVKKMKKLEMKEEKRRMREAEVGFILYY